MSTVAICVGVFNRGVLVGTIVRGLLEGTIVGGTSINVC